MKKFLLVVVVLGLAQWWYLRDGCGTKGSVACPPAELEEGVGVTLNARDVCPNAGYLCYKRESFQVLRWPLDKGRLRIRVPLPDFVDADTGQQIREAVVAGFREWDGHPFPIVIDTGRFSIRKPDITVNWTATMRPHSGSAGSVSPQARDDGKRLRFSIPNLTIVVPQQIGSLLGSFGGNTAIPDEIKGKLGLHETGPKLLEWVRATAAHELGHALGLLMHSDSTGDMMYFQMRSDVNQNSVSARDIQTVEALYALPNGAMVAR